MFQTQNVPICHDNIYRFSLVSFNYNICSLQTGQKYVDLYISVNGNVPELACAEAVHISCVRLLARGGARGNIPENRKQRLKFSPQMWTGAGTVEHIIALYMYRCTGRNVDWSRNCRAHNSSIYVRCTGRNVDWSRNCGAHKSSIYM